jgi:purine-binding chemotaxis protein CheW
MLVNDRRMMSGAEPEWPLKEWGKERNGTGSFASGLASSLAGAGVWDTLMPPMTVRGMLNPSAPPEGTPEDQGEQHLIFSLAEYECAVKAEHVQGVERLPDITPVPNVAHWIAGVISLRGQIISIVDLRSFLGLERQPVTPRTRLLAGAVGEMMIGLIVDGVSEMRGIPPHIIQSPGAPGILPAWTASYVSGVAMYGGQSVLLLDMERLLLSEKMQQYQS